MPSTSPGALNYSPSPVSNRDATFAVFAGFLGWTLDAFDFFLVVISLPRIASDFHSTTKALSYSLTLTLAFRPVGAFIFGLLADRFGRRWPMMIDLVFYSTIEVATAFAPNLLTFYILRALFGIGMGGEWGVGTSLVMEKVPRKWRGVLSGLLQEGYAFGYLLAGLAAYFLLDRTPPDAHHSIYFYGWRSLFLLGGLPALLALFIRFGIKESDVWQKNKAESWSNLGRGIASSWKIWIYLTLLMAMMNFSSHGTQDLFPTFMKEYRHMDPQAYSQVVMIMMVGAIIGGIGFGLASDRFGRRMMMVLAFVGALSVTHFWAFSTSMTHIAVAAFLLQFFVQGAWGIVPAHISELSPTKVRGFLPGFSYQCGNLIAASIGPLQTTLAEKHPYPFVLSISAGCIFIIAIFVTGAGPEKRAVDFDQP